MQSQLRHEERYGVIKRGTRARLAQAGRGHTPGPTHGPGPEDNERRRNLDRSSVRVCQVDREPIAGDGRVPAEAPELVDDRALHGRHLADD